MLPPYAQVATAQVIFFILCLLPTTYSLLNHGKRGALGWSYFLIFSILRMVGASLVISASDDIHPPIQRMDLEDALEKVKSAAILSSAGTTILVLGMQGLLHEIGSKFAFSHKVRWIHYLSFTTLQLSSLAGLILTCIGGADNSPTLADRYKLLKGGSLLLLHAYIGTIILSMIILFRIKKLPKHGERRLYYAVILASPFLFVRLLYAVLIVFVKNDVFRFILGNIHVFVGMAVVEEFVIMVVVLGAGIWTAKAIKEGEMAGDGATGERNREVPLEGDGTGEVAWKPTPVY